MALGRSEAGGWAGRGDPYGEHRHVSSRSVSPYAHEPDPEPAPAPRKDATIAIVRPADHQEVYAIGYEIGDYFRRDVPVIVNLEELTVENATRVVDFVAGAIFGRRGDMERLTNRLFLIIPPGATIIRP